MYLCNYNNIILCCSVSVKICDTVTEQHDSLIAKMICLSLDHLLLERVPSEQSIISMRIINNELDSLLLQGNK